MCEVLASIYSPHLHQLPKELYTFNIYDVGKNFMFSSLPGLGCFHANSGACHYPASFHKEHEEIVGTPIKEFQTILHRAGEYQNQTFA